jgi:hypothetical protein
MKVSLKRFALFASIIFVFSFRTGGDDPIAVVVKKLMDFYKHFPQEKIYIHTDRPYYLAGDTIWFRAYLVNATGHERSNLSNKVFVYLANEQDSIVEKLMLNAADDKLNGSMTIPDSLSEGNYVLRAYTARMLNFGDRFIFAKNLYIGSKRNKFDIEAEFSPAKEGSRPSNVVISLADLDQKPLGGEIGYLDLIKEGNILKESKFITDKNGKAAVSFENIKPEDWENAFIKLKYKSLSKLMYPSIAAADSLDIRFLPEGGNIISGTEAVVAFIAVDKGGLPIPIEGYVKNEMGIKVTNFHTFHDGMGEFTFIPGSGRAYFAVVTSKDGKEHVYALPPINNYAYQLSIVDENEKNLKVRVSLGDSLYKKNKKTFLLGTSQGKLCFAGSGRDMYEVEIPRDSFPEGVAKLTLFSDAEMPVSERLFFVKHRHSNVTIEGVREKYGARQPVSLTITSKDKLGNPAKGVFSIAVTDDAVVPSGESDGNIVTNLLLNEDLKGYIPNPAFYFDEKQAKANDALDLVMLTHGWSRYNWEEVMQNNYPPVQYGPDSALNISGHVESSSGEPVRGYPVSLYADKWGSSFLAADYENGIALDTLDEKGNFAFNNLIFQDSTQFMIQVKNRKKVQKNLKITLNKHNWTAAPPLVQTRSYGNSPMKEMLQNMKNRFKQDILSEGRGITLAPINLKTNKKPSYFNDKRRVSMTSSIITSDQIEKTGNINLANSLFLVPGVQLKQGRITIQGGVTFSGTSLVISEPILIVDGVPTDTGSGLTSVLNTIPYNTVDFIEVLKGNDEAAYGVRGANGVILVNTKQRDSRLDSSQYSRITEGRPIFYVPGYAVAKEIYVPKYDMPEQLKNPAPDLRPIIYWNGNIHVDDKGTANILFYTSDPVTTYSIILEGLTNSGDIVHQTAQIRRE